MQKKEAGGLSLIQPGKTHLAFPTVLGSALSLSRSPRFFYEIFCFFSGYVNFLSLSFTCFYLFGSRVYICFSFVNFLSDCLESLCVCLIATSNLTRTVSQYSSIRASDMQLGIVYKLFDKRRSHQFTLDGLVFGN